MPAGQNGGQVPVVTAILRSGTIELTLANEGQQEVTYTLTSNDFKGHTQTVAVKGGKSKTIGWPTDQDGYYDVVNGQIRRRLPPPLRGPHRLTGSIDVAPGIRASGATCRLAGIQVLPVF